MAGPEDNLKKEEKKQEVDFEKNLENLNIEQEVEQYDPNSVSTRSKTAIDFEINNLNVFEGQKTWTERGSSETKTLNQNESFAIFLGLEHPYEDWYNHLSEINSSVLDDEGNPLDPKMVTNKLQASETVYVYDADGDAPYAIHINAEGKLQISDNKVDMEHPVTASLVDRPILSKEGKAYQGIHDEMGHNYDSATMKRAYDKGITKNSTPISEKVHKLFVPQIKKAKKEYEEKVKNAPKEPKKLTGFQSFAHSFVKFFNGKGTALGQQYDREKAAHDMYMTDAKNVRDAALKKADDDEKAYRDRYINRTNTEKRLEELNKKLETAKNDREAYYEEYAVFVDQPTLKIEINNAIRNGKMTAQLASDMHMQIINGYDGDNVQSKDIQEFAKLALTERMAEIPETIKQVNAIGFDKAINMMCESKVFQQYYEGSKAYKPNALHDIPSPKNIKLTSLDNLPEATKAELNRTDSPKSIKLVDTIIFGNIEKEYQLNNQFKEEVQKEPTVLELINYQCDTPEEKLTVAIARMNEVIDNIKIDNPITMGAAKELKEKYASLKMLQLTEKGLDSLPEDKVELREKAAQIAIMDAFADKPNMNNKLYAQCYQDKAIDKAISNVQNSIFLGKLKNSTVMNTEYTMAKAQLIAQEKQAAKQQEGPKKEQAGPSV